MIDFMDEQRVNALYPILITLSGIVIVVREEQFENVSYPILEMLSGIVIDVG